MKSIFTIILSTSRLLGIAIEHFKGLKTISYNIAKKSGK